MGTRNLTCVYMNGEYKVAQYRQWDGYPEGLGTYILKFLKSVNIQLFKNAVSKVSFLTKEEFDDINKVIKATRETIPDYDWTKDFPHLSRDCGGEILNQIVFNGVTKVKNSLDFAKDSLLCEWGYVIDLDMNKFEVYSGFNREPLTASDRFYFNGEKAENDYEYYPIKKIAEFDLNDLPTEEEFLEHFKCEDDESIDED